jgi:hypothetical protein
LRTKEQETRLTLDEHDDDELMHGIWNIFLVIKKLGRGHPVMFKV